MKISIVIPVFNLEKYIEKCILSIINQKYKIFELIIVDDGSTDKSLEIVLDLLIENNFYDYKIIRQRNMGVSESRNNGLSNSSGEFVLFFDGDDYFEPDFSLIINKEIRDRSLDFICWKFNRVSEITYKNNDEINKNNDLLDEYMTGLELLDLLIIKKKIWLQTGCALYRREILVNNSLKYETKITNGEDQEFLFKFLIKEVKVKKINRYLTNYLIRNSSISNSFNINRLDVILALANVEEIYKNYGNKTLSRYLSYLEEMKILNFINTLQSLYKTSKYEDSKKLKYLIENKYPGLINEMSTLIRKKRVSFKKSSFKITLYKISPILFKFIVKIYYFIKSKKGN